MDVTSQNTNLPATKRNWQQYHPPKPYPPAFVGFLIIQFCSLGAIFAPEN